jgi:hypothetical protein
MRQRKLTMVFLAVWLSVAGGSGYVNAETYFGYDQWGGSWHDANKNFQGDSNLCWAAAASNILDWTGWGTHFWLGEAQIFDYFKQYWPNEAGTAGRGWDWYMNGTPYNSFGGGNFWPIVNFRNYYYGQTMGNTMDVIDHWLRNGYGIVIMIGTPTGGSHLITVWGVDYLDAPNDLRYYFGLFVTDSDDKKTSMFRVGVDWNSDWSVWHLKEYGGDQWYITSVQALDRLDVTVPAPPTVLLLGSGLLGLVGWRRFRKS